MFGLITAAVNKKFGWWSLLTIPVWFVISFYLKKLLNYKPQQRMLEDYNK